MAVWELLAPRRALQQRRSLRWTNNLALTVLNSVLVRTILPVAAIGVAAFAAERGMGLLNVVHVPYPLAIVLSVLALDLAIYLQHLMFHAVPLFWRLHRVHHADLDFDVTTGARFHPVEIVSVDADQVRRDPRAGPAGGRGAAVRGPAQCHVDVQPRQRAPAGGRRPRPALARGDAGHAPRPPLDRSARDQQQLRLQPAVVGPAVRHLPGAARGRSRGDDDRHRAVPRPRASCGSTGCCCNRFAPTPAATRSAGRTRQGDRTTREPRGARESQSPGRPSGDANGERRR